MAVHFWPVEDLACVVVDADCHHYNTVIGQVRPIPENRVLHIPNCRPVEVDISGRDRPSLNFRLFPIDGDPISVFQHLHRFHTHLPGKFGMRREMSVFTVDRDERPRPHDVEEREKLLSGGVTRNMDMRAPAVNHLGSPTHQIGNHLRYCGLVAWYRLRRDEHRVRLVELDELVTTL